MATDPLLETVNAGIERALETMASAVAPVGAEAAGELTSPVATLATRGKRMRAALLVTAHTAAGGQYDDAAAGVAAALELFQVAALIHDDVLDDSDTRRGVPSAHRTLESVHAASGLRGDAPRFGINAAILAGDLALMECMRALVCALAPVDAAIAAAVGNRFATMASLCTAGQYLDLRLAAMPLERALDDTDSIMATMRSKTASYTTEGPLVLGAALAGRSAREVDDWASVGVPLGIAFQLRDDILGVIGSEEVTGKPAGDDVREGKRTLLAAHAWEHAGADGRALLMAAEGSHDADAVARAVEVIRTTGAIDEVERAIARHAAAAIDAIGALDIEQPYRDRLAELASRAVARDA